MTGSKVGFAPLATRERSEDHLLRGRDGGVGRVGGHDVALEAGGGVGGGDGGVRVQVDEVGAVRVGGRARGSDGRGGSDQGSTPAMLGNARRVAVAGRAVAAGHLGEAVHVGPEGDVDGAVGVDGVGVAVGARRGGGGCRPSSGGRRAASRGTSRRTSGVVSFQAAATRVPVTAPMVKLPWHETLLQVIVAGSYVAPAWWTAGFCEKSTTNPVGAWQPAQVRAGPVEPPWRWIRWFAPTGVIPGVVRALVRGGAREGRQGEEEDRRTGAGLERGHGPPL